ncbi:hypothetical protein FEM48_Zijuj10G0066600 [Ziziphus jujuba var. spinosa]|uniref:Uncharacterized protein n=1 Tax=Ziziphus jujuba var. spinosa TaxID=714518 RepID=A0A978ULW6_ZIZJJ|nr:hypothetical protein FEM48_Zijuj10G0066600 [Ziziphus jujuba var. spinosa]
MRTCLFILFLMHAAGAIGIAYAGTGHTGMVPAMISSVEMMLKRWKSYEGKEVEIFQEFRLLTSEVISRTAIGCNYLRGKDIFEMLTRLALLTTKNMYKLRLPGISKFFKTADEIEADMLEKKFTTAS